MSYKKLEIWELAREMSIKIHKMSITALPKFEMYEEGSQIRRSIKSVRFSRFLSHIPYHISHICFLKEEVCV